MPGCIKIQNTSTSTVDRVSNVLENVNEPIPLVIVQGFLGSTGAWLWGDFEHYLNRSLPGIRRRTIFVSVGPVSSLHDRACELYYALMGGTVDYGVEHSEIHKHSRHGRKILQGQYPEWSPRFPLHFMAHSLGGPTIIKLQSLIKQGHFGPGAHPRMVLSVTAISAPFRGTQAVYLLGERRDAAPAVRPLSFGSILGKAVHILSFIAPLLPPAFDMHGDCRSLTYRDVSVVSLLKQLWRSDWAEGRDATPFDVTFQAADERESSEEGDPDPETFYQSHVAWMTRKRRHFESYHTPSIYHVASPLMYISSRFIGIFNYSTLRPFPSFFPQESTRCDPSVADSAFDMGEEYWANDGIVPIFSQWHPHSCRRTRCLHLASPSTDKSTNEGDVPEPGIWYVNYEEDANHMSIVPRWTGTDRQQQFWLKLGRWLSAVEETRRQIC
ncbi:alpha/beta-hydrolase [Mycena maculata]|uniref:Alpha/beta-hydrolase n=1 Tax=Mycena maculata TaxID=230809 RepID=A0AAD7N9S6_9AGAR|nr:alpha/beta-hydrolase [Mycena maculata]